MSLPDKDSPHTGLRRIANATGILIAAQILGAVLQLVSLRTVQDTLTKSGNGEFFWVQQVSMFAFFVMVEMGMTSIATRMVAQQPDTQDRIIATFFKLRVLLWILASLVVCVFCFVRSPQNLSQISIYALFSLIGARTMILRPVLEVRRRAQNLQLLPAFAGLLDAALFAVFIFADASTLTPFRVMVWFLVSAVPGFVIMLCADQQWCSIWSEPLDRTIATALLRESFPLLASLLLLQIQDKSDTFALDFFHGKEALGVYAATMRIVAQGGMLMMVLPTVISPVVSALRVSDEERCRVYMIEGLNITLLASILAASMILALVQPLTFITAGKQYLSHSAEFSLAGWTLLGSMTVAYILALMTAIGEQRKLYAMVWTLAICSILLNLAFTPHWGAFGAIFSKLITTLIGTGVGLVAMYSFVRDKSLVRGLIRIFLVVVVVAPSSVMAREGSQMLALRYALPIFIQHFIAGASVCAVFGGMCVLTQLVSWREFTLLKSLLKRA
jgi:O-antigen/teichoic acid export membrane protein